MYNRKKYMLHIEFYIKVDLSETNSRSIKMCFITSDHCQSTDTTFTI